MSEKILEILLEKLLPAISTSGSSFLMTAIALWIFYKGFKPIMNDFNHYVIFVTVIIIIPGTCYVLVSLIQLALACARRKI